MIAEIIIQWGVDDRGANSPQLAEDYPNHQMIIKDTTEQSGQNLKPNPNMYIVEVICSQATLDVIKADSKYLILWSENE